MTCCEPQDTSSPAIAEGLSSLPRQLRGFPEVRRDLLKELGQNPGALSGWRPSGDDFGLMWLEMWAYVADVLGFYDERVANESYLRTAVRGSSLRRIVELLGHTPLPGVAASATLAVLADGAVAVNLGPTTAFRSRPFDGQPPQVFETGSPATIHPLKNKWIVSTFKRRPTVDPVPDLPGRAPADKKNATPSTPKPNVAHLLFESGGFGLAAGQIVLIDSRDPGAVNPADPPVTLVASAQPFEGKDKTTYMQVELKPPIRIDPAADLSQLRARRPTQSVAPTINQPLIFSGKAATLPVKDEGEGTAVYVDQVPGTFRRGDPIIVASRLGSGDAQYMLTTIESVAAAAVRVASIPPLSVPVPQPEGGTENAVVPSPVIGATKLLLTPSLPTKFVDHPAELTLLHNFVEGGQPTNVGRSAVKAADLGDPEGTPLDGQTSAPPDAAANAAALGLVGSTNVTGILEQQFLVQDAADGGALVDGRITFTTDGRATFQLLSADGLQGELKLPLEIYGNVLSATRGQIVAGEVLGNGNARLAHQRFKLRKKPLTYLSGSAASADALASTTLRIWVDGVLWKELPSFFGQSPTAQVYIVRHDDQSNTFVTFGDGVRGSRLPSGVKNVVAVYRFGSGAAAPPARAITQLGSAVKGLKGVRSPVASSAGKDADKPEELRRNAPRNALLFGREVSAADFGAMARQLPGVVRASAEWLWIPSQMQAGVWVHYIGTADASALAQALRAQADPSVPVEVTAAQPVPAKVTIAVEVDERYVKEEVAAAVAAHLTDPKGGALSLLRARIGGMFWPGSLFEGVAEVPGALGVAGLGFTTAASDPQVSSSSGTCLPAGRYLDFTQPGSVSVIGVDPVGATPRATGGTA